MWVKVGNHTYLKKSDPGNRYSSLAALIATFSIPVYSYFLEQDSQYIISFSVIALILLWRHKSNIQNLLNNKENKINVYKQD